MVTLCCADGEKSKWVDVGVITEQFLAWNAVNTSKKTFDNKKGW